MKTEQNLPSLSLSARVLLLLACLCSNIALAHHSAAMFDLDKELVLSGTVSKYQFTNPHVWIHVSVSNPAGETTVWKIEALNPNALKRKGWKRNSFQPGDKISITVYPAKSGEPKGGFIRAVTADGTALGKPLPVAGQKEEWHDDL